MAARAVASLLESKGGSIPEPVDALVVSDGTEPPTVIAVPRQAVTAEDIHMCWQHVIEAAAEGKAWALKFVLEKHPLAKRYAQLERQLAGLDGDAIARIAADAGELPQLTTEGEPE